MTSQLSAFVFIVGLLCTLAASDLRAVAGANVVIAAAVQAEIPAPASEAQVAALEAAFPSAESAVAAAQVARRAEH